MVHKLSRKTIQAVKPYTTLSRDSSTPPPILLNANENPYPRQCQLVDHIFNRYPDPQPLTLIKNYAAYLGVSEDNVLVSLGGDESIRLIIEAFCEPNEEAILYCPPTFGMYEISANVIGVATIPIPLTETFMLNVPAIKDNIDRAKVVFICSPNNPTGNLMDERDIVALLEATRDRAILVLDEAYVEFSTRDSMVNLLDVYPHLAIIRTLSKAFGLAGIRCGFTVGSKELIDVLKKVIAPYPIPQPVIDIAVEAVNPEGVKEMWRVVNKINQSKVALAKALSKLQIVEKIYPSDANWLLVAFKDTERVYQYLLSQNIHVRDQKGPLQEMLRISIGTDEEHEILLDALKCYEEDL